MPYKWFIYCVQFWYTLSNNLGFHRVNMSLWFTSVRNQKFASNTQSWVHIIQNDMTYLLYGIWHHLVEAASQPFGQININVFQCCHRPNISISHTNFKITTHCKSFFVAFSCYYCRISVVPGDCLQFYLQFSVATAYCLQFYLT